MQPYIDSYVTPLANVFGELSKAGLLSVAYLGTLAYAFFIAKAAFWDGSLGLNDGRRLALPACAAAAYVIVHLFSAKNPSGDLRFTAFGLEFTGPAGPVTLWIVCYLALAVSVRLLDLPK